MKSLSIHSHKGGVGKSTITVNIAVELAKTSNVFIIDNDLAGPTMQTFFPLQDKEYVNRYLTKEVALVDCINTFKDDRLNGNLYYALADPTAASVGGKLRLDKKSATMMLRQFVALKKTLVDDYKIDYLIVDTSPGVHITTANAFVATDYILFINKLSNADIEGSANMIKGILEYMENRAFMIANQVPTDKITKKEDKDDLISLMASSLEEKIGRKIVEVIDVLPVDDNLSMLEFEAAITSMRNKEEIVGSRTNRHIYALDEPEHKIQDNVKSIINKIFGVKI